MLAYISIVALITIYVHLLQICISIIHFNYFVLKIYITFTIYVWICHIFLFFSLLIFCLRQKLLYYYLFFYLFLK